MREIHYLFSAHRRNEADEVKVLVKEMFMIYLYLEMINYCRRGGKRIVIK